MGARIAAVAVVAIGLASPLAACAEEEDERRERADAPARPPSGWRTVTARAAGFTISAPRRWSARTRRTPVLIRSADGLLVATVAVDRGATGKDSPPGDYARAVVDRLPGFEGSIDPEPRRVAGSPYPSGRVDAVGRVETSPAVQRITVAAFQRRGLATYAVVAFRNGRVAPRRHDRAVRRMLASLRARSPAGAH